MGSSSMFKRDNLACPKTAGMKDALFQYNVNKVLLLKDFDDPKKGGI